MRTSSDFDRWRALQVDVLPDVRLEPPDWHQAARCRGRGNAAWFSTSTSEAKAVCRLCPVQAECLAFAMTDPHIVGVWGGTSTQDRAAMRREQRAA